MKQSIIETLEYSFTGRRDMTEAYLVAQDLSNLDLSRAILDGAELDCATLRNANLSETSLKNTSFFSADLEGVNLSHAKVNNCDFRHANLERAELKGVNFSTCNVRGAIFTGVQGLSLQQKLWLKSNGALNVSLEDEKINLNQHGNNQHLFQRLKGWLSFS